jgi:hypothetical protein
MTQFDENVRVRAGNPRCDHARQIPQNEVGAAEGSGLYFICTDCGAFIQYRRPPRRSNLDVA